MKRYARILLVGGMVLLGFCCFASGLPRGLSFFVNRWSAYPAWSPDGERIAYTCHYPTLFQVLEDKGSSLFNWGYIPGALEICTIKPNGRGFVRLTRNDAVDSRPAWSPDGQWIAYISEIDAGSMIQLLKEDGSQSQSLGLGTMGISGEELKWSPDGKHLCFTAREYPESEQGYNLYVANLEDGTVRALTTLPGYEFDANWSPDGTKISFVQRFSGEADPLTIWIADMEGRLDAVDPVAPEFDDVCTPFWNPEGTQLVFCGSWHDDSGIYAKIYTVDLASGEVRCLTEGYDLYVLDWAAWTPAGDRVAFTESGDLYTVLPDGSDLTQIASLPQSSYHLVWALNGKSLAFERGIEGDKSRIWLVDMTDGRLRELRTP